MTSYWLEDLHVQVVKCIITWSWDLMFWIIKQVTVTYGQSVQNFLLVGLYILIYFSFPLTNETASLDLSLLFLSQRCRKLIFQIQKPVHRNTQSLPVIDYPSPRFDMASLENSNRIRNKEDEDQCFCNLVEVCHNCYLPVNGKVEVKLMCVVCSADLGYHYTLCHYITFMDASLRHLFIV